jgi:hypothetical protein
MLRLSIRLPQLATGIAKSPIDVFHRQPSLAKADVGPLALGRLISSGGEIGRLLLSCPLSRTPQETGGHGECETREQDESRNRMFEPSLDRFGHAAKRQLDLRAG